MTTPTNDSIDKAAGRVMRRLRHDAGMTQDELAAKAHMSLSTLKRYELGDRSMPLPTFYVVCECLGVTRDEFLDEVDRILRRPVLNGNHNVNTG